MSELVKRWTTRRPSDLDPVIHTSGLGEVEVVPAVDYDALLAERDAARADAERLAEVLDGFDRYSTGPDYNGSPFERKVQAALDAHEKIKS